MRRSDKEIRDIHAVEAVIKQATICHVGVSDNGQPYVVPVCFGYRDRVLYIHSAPEGRKIDILQNNNRVCVQFEADCETVEAPDACRWSMKYRSVIAFGKASFVHDNHEKRQALDLIMAHYSPRAFQYRDGDFEKIVIIRIDIEHMTGKESGYRQ